MLHQIGRVDLSCVYVAGQEPAEHGGRRRVASILRKPPCGLNLVGVNDARFKYGVALELRRRVADRSRLAAQIDIPQTMGFAADKSAHMSIEAVEVAFQKLRQIDDGCA